MHVHSSFSDGVGTIEENLAAAELRGLSRVTFVDHVRASTGWARDFVREVRRVAARTDIDVRCGFEAKMLDVGGSLDLPDDLAGADYVYVADHRVPLVDGPVEPSLVRVAIAEGQLESQAVIRALLQATTNAIQRLPNAVIAHLFSVLPKIGLRESDVSPAALEELARATASCGAQIEIDERWRCPSARTVRFFREAGVPILLSTDSHSPDSIGCYAYCLRVLAELEIGQP
jgi:putative hydrolase